MAPLYYKQDRLRSPHLFSLEKLCSVNGYMLDQFLHYGVYLKINEYKELTQTKITIQYCVFISIKQFITLQN